MYPFSVAASWWIFMVNICRTDARCFCCLVVLFLRWTDPQNNLGRKVLQWFVSEIENKQETLLKCNLTFALKIIQNLTDRTFCSPNKWSWHKGCAALAMLIMQFASQGSKPLGNVLEIRGSPCCTTVPFTIEPSTPSRLETFTDSPVFPKL